MRCRLTVYLFNWSVAGLVGKEAANTEGSNEPSERGIRIFDVGNFAGAVGTTGGWNELVTQAQEWTKVLVE